MAQDGGTGVLVYVIMIRAFVQHKFGGIFVLFCLIVFAVPGFEPRAC